MKNHPFVRSFASIALLLFFGNVLISCSKEDLSSEMITAELKRTPPGKNKTTDTSTSGSTTTTTTDAGTTTTTTTVTSGTALYIFAYNWDNRADGLYGLTESTLDFGPTIYWNAFNTQTSGKMLKATLAANVVGTKGGWLSAYDVADASEYELQFDVMFDNNFDWSAGGKVGFGFLIGNGQTGGSSTADGTGGSARIMWEKNSSGRVYLKPYLYYRDMAGTWGDDLGKTFPASGSIQRSTWYNVKMYVKSNTGSNTDGHIRIVINGTTLLDQPIRWTTDDTKRLINKICVSTFRGGSESFYASSTDGDIYFDNVSWSVYKY